MGDSQKEKMKELLILAPLPEPLALTDRIRKKFPQVNVVFRTLNFSGVMQYESEAAPEGMSLLASSSRFH
jgi:hypothetical protein